MQNKPSNLLVSVLLASVSSLACADDAKKQKYFSKFDLDNNNHLSLEEYSSMLKVRFEKSDKSGWEKQANKRMGFKDENGDGQLNFAEWQQSR
jgi:Ca2+-binding EF-hand superfamily protein